MRTQIQEKVKDVTTREDVAKVVQEFEQVIKNKKSDTLWLTYLPSKTNYFRKLKKKNESLAYGFKIWF